MMNGITRSFNKSVPIASLVGFRIVFGLLMFLSVIRFWMRGWVEAVYILPKFHFSYTGFEWVHALGSTGMYMLFGLILVSSFMICAGLFYRHAAVLFFACFTYVELIDATTYLNHYYFVSLIAFIMIWLPANRYYSLDSYLGFIKKKSFVPQWTIGILKLQMGIVYVFAGIAKLNTDWLFHAFPLRIWLPSKTHLPIIGAYMYEPWVAYLFSWFGAAYDLFIVFFLLHKRTRPIAYGFVLVFHAATALFFPGIGMFPYVMIACSLIFFSSRFHNKLLSFLPFYKATGDISYNSNLYQFQYKTVMFSAVAIYLCFQLLIPLRFLLYPGHLFWHEEGYRFSWRVMLMEKSGAAFFTVKDRSRAVQYEVNNAAYLTPLQEKMMSTQPDMILKYAHYIADVYQKQGMKDPEVYAEVYVALNGRRSRLFVDSTVNLVAEPIGFNHYQWILPYKQ